MKVTERDLKAVEHVGLSHLWEALDLFQMLCNEYDGVHFAAATLYYLGHIHGIQQERARRHKNPLSPTKVNRGNKY